MEYTSIPPEKANLIIFHRDNLMIFITFFLGALFSDKRNGAVTYSVGQAYNPTMIHVYPHVLYYAVWWGDVPDVPTWS